jgi:hypothetical protein
MPWRGLLGGFALTRPMARGGCGSRVVRERFARAQQCRHVTDEQWFGEVEALNLSPQRWNVCSTKLPDGNGASGFAGRAVARRAPWIPRGIPV